MVPEEIIKEKIYLIRDVKVMLDMDLSELYGVETRVLKQTVRRNINRFPGDFMFVLTRKEHDEFKQHFGTRQRGSHSKYPPFAFSEQGVAMLSSVLNSERAIMVNIQIIRIFTRLREILTAHKEVLERFDRIEYKMAEHDQKILVIFEYLKQLEQIKREELEKSKRSIIKGFKSNDQKK